VAAGVEKSRDDSWLLRSLFGAQHAGPINFRNPVTRVNEPRPSGVVGREGRGKDGKDGGGGKGYSCNR
jgi:hypothetical protein